MKSALAFAAGMGLAWLVPRAGGPRAAGEVVSPQGDLAMAAAESGERGQVAEPGGQDAVAGWRLPSSPSMERRLRDLMALKDEGQAEALSHWPLEDMQRAWRCLVGRWGQDDYDDKLAGSLIRAWTSRDQPAALAAALEHPSRDGRSSLIGITLGESLASDPDKTLALIETLKSRANRKLVVSAALKEWAKLDVEAAMGFALANEGHGGIGRIFTVASGGGESLSGEQLAASALKMSDPMGRGVLMAIAAEKMAESDPAKAWQWLLDRELDPLLAVLMSDGVVLRAWSKKSPEAAMEAVSGIENASLRSNMAKVVIRGAASGEMAAEAVLAMGALADQSVLIRTLGDRFDRKLDLDDVRQTARMLLDPAEQSQFLASVIDNRMIQADIAKAAVLVNEIPDDAIRDRSVMTLAHNWANADAKAADAWVRQIPPSAERDWALAGIIAESAGDDARAAMNLLPLFQDSDARTAATMTIAAKWLKKDTAAANQWMSNQPLTAEQRSQIAEAARIGGSDGGFKPDGGWTGKP